MRDPYTLIADQAAELASAIHKRYENSGWWRPSRAQVALLERSRDKLREQGLEAPAIVAKVLKRIDEERQRPEPTWGNTGS